MSLSNYIMMRKFAEELLSEGLDVDLDNLMDVFSNAESILRTMRMVATHLGKDTEYIVVPLMNLVRGISSLPYDGPEEEYII